MVWPFSLGLLWDSKVILIQLCEVFGCVAEGAPIILWRRVVNESVH
jgi:hypothetical protein